MQSRYQDSTANAVAETDDIDAILLGEFFAAMAWHLGGRAGGDTLIRVRRTLASLIASLRYRDGHIGVTWVRRQSALEQAAADLAAIRTIGRPAVDHFVAVRQEVAK